MQSETEKADWSELNMIKYILYSGIIIAGMGMNKGAAQIVAGVD